MTMRAERRRGLSAHWTSPRAHRGAEVVVAAPYRPRQIAVALVRATRRRPGRWGRTAWEQPVVTACSDPLPALTAGRFRDGFPAAGHTASILLSCNTGRRFPSLDRKKSGKTAPLSRSSSGNLPSRFLPVRIASSTASSTVCPGKSGSATTTSAVKATIAASPLRRGGGGRHLFLPRPTAR